VRAVTLAGASLLCAVSEERGTTRMGRRLRQKLAESAERERSWNRRQTAAKAVAWMVPFVPDEERGSGSPAIGHLVAVTPMERFLNQSQPGWLTSLRKGGPIGSPKCHIDTVALQSTGCLLAAGI
jgi:hypothetical protein